MSIAAACPGCLNGQHEYHNRDWNIMKGRIGGAYCPCNGDCGKIPDRVARMLAAHGEQHYGADTVTH